MLSLRRPHCHTGTPPRLYLSIPLSVCSISARSMVPGEGSPFYLQAALGNRHSVLELRRLLPMRKQRAVLLCYVPDGNRESLKMAHTQVHAHTHMHAHTLSHYLGQEPILLRK